MKLHAPLRIRRASGAAGQPPADSYMERLIKLVPSEVIGIFLTGKGYAESWLGIWSLICLGLVCISRVWGTRDPGKRTQWIGVLVSIISFVVWIYAIGAHIINITIPQNISYIAVLIWTFIVPYVYKGD
jgi:hypothetical protein